MKKYVYSLLLSGIAILWSSGMLAQADQSTRPSPLVEVHGAFEEAEIAIAYSSPAVKGRTIWGDLVPYDKVWRTGANEATTFETDQPIQIQDTILPAGKYGLFAIPGELEWTWIFNSVWDQWGAFKYDKEKDVLRVKAVPQPSSVFHERMNFVIDEKSISLQWENLTISLN